MRYEQSLSVVLHALSADIAPSLSDGKAKAALLAIQEVIAGLILSSAEEDRGDPSLASDFFGGSRNYADNLAALEGWLKQAPCAERDAAVKQLLAWENGALGTLHQRRLQVHNIAQGDGAAPADEASGPPLALLERYIRENFPASREARVTALKPFTGGFSKFTGLVEIERSGDLPARFVFRQDKAVTASGGPSVVGEFALLRGLHARGLRVPEPYHLERGPSMLGRPFVFSEMLRGAPASGLLTGPFSAAVGVQMARELAGLHNIPYGELGDMVADYRPPDLADFAAELDRFEAAWNMWPQPSTLIMSWAIPWLRDNLDLAVRGEPALLHRDPLFHNVLSDGDELVAVLDWEFARIGYPAEDLGWIRSAVEATVPWAEFMAAYEETRGQKLDQEQLDFYCIWGGVRLASMIAHSNALVDQGALDDIGSLRVAFRDTYLTQQWLGSHVERIVNRPS